jgi:hypothetical protein
MTNPYQAPAGTNDISQKREKRPSTYRGGLKAVALLAIGAGLVVGVILTQGVRPRFGFYVAMGVTFGVPLVAWLATFVLLLRLIKGVDVSGSRLFLTAIGLSIPAYILYVPVCSLTSLATSSLVGKRHHGPEPNIEPAAAMVMLSSAFAFLMILMAFAAIVRRCYRVPVSPAVPAADNPPDAPDATSRGLL